MAALYTPPNHSVKFRIKGPDEATRMEFSEDGKHVTVWLSVEEVRGFGEALAGMEAWREIES